MLERLLKAALANLLSGLNNDSYAGSTNFWEKYKRYQKYKEKFNESNYNQYDKKNHNEYKYNYKNNQNPEKDKLAQYYANLELPNGASLEEVKSSWKRLLKKYHPDRHNNNENDRKTATILTQKLNEAYFALEKELKK